MVNLDLPSQFAQINKQIKEQQSLLASSQQIKSGKKLCPPEDFFCYPGLEENQSEEDEVDNLSQSYDIQMDPDTGLHRQRSNTAQKLEKMDMARRKAAKIKNIKFDDHSASSTTISSSCSDLFVRKEVTTTNLISGRSLLSDQLKQCPKQPQNKFLEYAKYDGTAQTGIATRTIKIFLTMLPENRKNYPMQVCVTATAKIQEFIGLICYKCSIQFPDVILNSVRNYGLYITEEDGDVEDLPALDLKEPCSKFCFSHLALVGRKLSESLPNRTEDYRAMSMTSDSEDIKAALIAESKAKSEQESEDLARMLGHTTMMEAPLYRSYRLQIMNKALFKTEIQLGISGEKVEIDPVPQKNSKFWSRQKAVSHSMDSIACCEILENKTSRATFRICGIPSSFKNYDFETDPNTAQEIIEKINNILDVRSSATRRDFLASKEKRKSLQNRSKSSSQK